MAIIWYSEDDREDSDWSDDDAPRTDQLAFILSYITPIYSMSPDDDIEREEARLRQRAARRRRVLIIIRRARTLRRDTDFFNFEFCLSRLYNDQ